MTLRLEVIVTPGLGDNSYVLSSEGRAAVIDPQRDVERYLDAAEASGSTIALVLETHVHNDYVSGATELRDATGAEIVGPDGAEYAFDHRGVGGGDEIELGELRLRAMASPGHTPEHVSYLVFEPGSDAPSAVFTGGSLMVGGAGRTDLLGPAQTDGLTRDQYRSLRRLADLPDATAVLPTHGAGSFCGATGPDRAERTSTIGKERRLNGALRAPDEESFVREQLSGLLAYPAYYRHMAAINRDGPSSRGSILPVAMEPAEVEARMRSGVWLVDGRWRVQFARAHVPGSVNVELDDSFGSYVGWIVPFDAPVMLVLPDPPGESLREATTQLSRIGYDRVEGYLRGGMVAWRASGRPAASYEVAGLERLCREIGSGAAPRVLDVRQDVEWDAGHIAGSRHLFVGDLPDRIGEVGRGAEVWAICRTGHRSSIAASLLDRQGIPVRLVDGTGVEDFLKHCAPELREPATS